MKFTLTMRLWFAFVAAILWIGMYFAGFALVNWLIYLLAIGFIVGSLFGYCPSQIAVLKLLKNKQN